MGTRTYVLFKSGHNTAYRAYYRHYDGYPTCTGFDILKGIVDTMELDSIEAEKAIIEAINSTGTPERPIIRREGNLGNRRNLDHILTEKASDIEWVYTVNMVQEAKNRGMEIHKSVGSYANGTDMKPFIAKIWGVSYMTYIDHFLRFNHGTQENKIAEKMEQVEQLGATMENMIKGYHRANHNEEKED